MDEHRALRDPADQAGGVDRGGGRDAAGVTLDPRLLGEPQDVGGAGADVASDLEQPGRGSCPAPGSGHRVRIERTRSRKRATTWRPA